MLMSASQYQADPVVTSRIVADSFLRQVKATPPAPHRINVVSMLRLLDMYAADRFANHQPMGILESDAFHDLNATGDDSALSDIRSAISSVHRSLDSQSDKTQFAQKYRGVISRVGAPKHKVEPEELRLVQDFLKLLRDALVRASSEHR